jgi:hypothetical protein
LIKLLAASSPATTGRDDAYMLLSSLSIPELLALIEGVADCGYLPQLHARVISWTNPFTLARLLSALYAVEFVRVSPTSIATGQLKVAGMALDLLPHDQQIQIVEYVLHHRGAGVSVTEVFEGALAMREGKDAARGPQAVGGDAATAGAGTHGPAAAGSGSEPPAPVEPGPWAPPGEQPIPLYIGNAAHTGIALNYVNAHPGERVATNASPVKSILESLRPLLSAQGQKVDPSALADDDLGLRPDIMNPDAPAPLRDQAACRGGRGRRQGGDVRQLVREGRRHRCARPDDRTGRRRRHPGAGRRVHVLVAAAGSHRLPVPAG